MRDGTLWTVVMILVAGIVSGQRDHGDEIHLDGAMVGFNAFCMNALTHPNPGTKSMILKALKTPLTSDTDDLDKNQFVDEAEHFKCTPQLSVQTISNYVEYKQLAASSVFQLSSPADDTTTSVRYDNDFLCNVKSNRRDKDIAKFFKDTAGEIVFASTECVTHTITISPFGPLTFTDAFELALVSLYKAALKPNSKSSDRTVLEFIWSYGTHFSKRTLLGAKVFMGKLFPARSSTLDEEAARRRCVLQAAFNVLTSNWRAMETTDDTYRHFAREASKSCGDNGDQVMVSIAGPLPQNSLRDWADTVEEIPDPIFYSLEPISTLFTRDWLTRHPGISNINKTILHQFVADKVLLYRNLTLTGGFDQPELKGCGLNSQCQPGYICRNEPNTKPGYRCLSQHDVTSTSTATARPTAATTATTTVTSTGTVTPVGSGGVFIIGGAGVRMYSEAINGSGALPPFPGLVFGNAVVSVGSTVYSCGGQGKYERACYFASPNDPTWQSIALPWPINTPTAVTVQNSVVWFLQDTHLYTFATTRNRGQFRQYMLQFPFSVHFCAVSNQTHTFAIGVGLGFDEVWVNKDPSKPTKWDKFSNLLESRRGQACLWFGSEIFVSGGQDGDYNGVDSVEVINVQDKTIRSVGPLVYSREEHQMAVLEGKPAVLGGYSFRVPTNTIEVYHSQHDFWDLVDYTMKETRTNFGLTQY